MSSNINILYSDSNENISSSSNMEVSYLSVLNTMKINNNLNSNIIKQGGNILIASGTITMWYSNNKDEPIPKGWVLCNGQTINGIQTPDLRDKFVVGAGYTYSVKQEGGENKVTLSLSKIPSHNHIATDSGHSHVYYDKYPFFYGPNAGGSTYAESTEKHTTNTGKANITLGYTGGNQPHENRPPFYALYYIMKI